MWVRVFEWFAIQFCVGARAYAAASGRSLAYPQGPWVSSGRELMGRRTLKRPNHLSAIALGIKAPNWIESVGMTLCRRRKLPHQSHDSATNVGAAGCACVYWLRGPIWRREAKSLSRPFSAPPMIAIDETTCVCVRGWVVGGATNACCSTPAQWEAKPH